MLCPRDLGKGLYLHVCIYSYIYLCIDVNTYIYIYIKELGQRIVFTCIYVIIYISMY